ncbi:MAG: hypothetical protein ACK4VZ_15905 [Paracoccaceae bacterium]
MALIRRGVLQDLRHARFYGFDLTPDQMEQAREMPMSRTEDRHHNRVMDDLRVIGERIAPHSAEFTAKRATVKPDDEAV